MIGLPCMDAPRVSAKTGLNVDQCWSVWSAISHPTGDGRPLKALIFDSIYDSYKGVIVYIRVFEGSVKPGDTIRMMATGAEFTLVEVGHMGATALTPCAQLQAGEVGYLTASIKTSRTPRGDTVTPGRAPHRRSALPATTSGQARGVLCGIYHLRWCPKYPAWRRAGKIAAERASAFELETSAALSFRLPLRFLGLLHMRNHHRSAQAGVRSGYHHHHPQRALPSDPDRRHSGNDRQPFQLPGPQQHRQTGRALCGCASIHSQRLCGRPDGSVPEQARRADRHEVSGRCAGGPALRALPLGESCTTSSTPKTRAQPRLRQLHDYEFKVPRR